MPDPTTTTPAPHTGRNLRFLFLSLAVLAAIFSGMVAGALLMVHLDPRNVHPPETAQLAQLKDEIVKDPANTKLRELFDSLDQSNRAYLLARDRRLYSGAFLLAASIALLVVSALLYARMDPRPLLMKRPSLAPPASWLTPRRRNVIALSAGGSLILLAFLLTARLGGPLLPQPPPPDETEPSPFRQNWPGFRGPDGLGIAPPGDWPLSWDLKSRTNILWQSEVPLPGESSPVAWGNRIFLTGATPKLQEVFCFDRSSGKLLWRTSVSSPDSRAWMRAGEAERVSVSEDTGYAAPSPVTDGKLLFVIFATNDVAALDFRGKIKWVRNLGKPESSYGLSSSPLLYQDTLIYQCDQGSSPEDNLSAIYGLDKESGDVIWRTDRPVNNSWGSPILAPTPAPVQIITIATPWVIACDPLFGSELWRANVMGSAEIGPSPAYADGIVYVSDDEADLIAIRTDGRGDVTATKVLWRSSEGLPDAASPVSDGKFLVQTDSSGLITCFDAKVGKLLWKKDLKGEFWSSPVISGSLVFAFDRKGGAVVFELGDAYKQLGSGELGEPVDATPAFADSVIYVRTEKHLVAIGTGK